jgi:hypothetical protein
MAESYCEVWTTDGTGNFTVATPYEELRRLVADPPGPFLDLLRVSWQDPAEPGGVDDLWPVFEQVPVAIRVDAITSIGPAFAGTVAGIHRARAESLR